MSASNASRGLGPGARDLLRGPSTAVVFVDADGMISLWGPEAQSLLGYRAEEVCGTPAVELLTVQEGRDAVRVAHKRGVTGQVWDGVVGLGHRDGHTVEVALRIRPVERGEGRAGWSVSAADAREVERDYVDRAVLEALFNQSPISVTVMDAELRHQRVNSAAERITSFRAEQLIGRRIGELTPRGGVEEIEGVLRRVRDTGEPVLDFKFAGYVPSDPDREHVWSLSSFRLTDPAGGLLGMCQTFVDVTEGHRAQQRLALLAEASEHVGSTLDVVRTAQELADTSVPGLADFVSVDLLEAAVRGEKLNPDTVTGRVLLRRAGFCSVRQGSAAAAYPVGDIMALHPGTLQARCLTEGRSVLARRLGTDDWPDLDARVAAKMRELGVHSLMVVPLRARGITLGVASFGRGPASQRYDEGDLSLAEEVCSRAALCVDNARRYTREHTTALALQRSLLPHDLPEYLAVETAHRYVPAAAHAGAGGDWYDVLPLSGARVGLVVGDVIGHDLHAAAIMGRLRTAVHTLAALDLDPDEVLTQLDDLVLRLIQEDSDFLGATCLYAVYDPVSRLCTFARAGHPPPALVEPDGVVEFLHDIPSNLPLGVGGLPFETIERQLPEGTVLALYTDGLVEDLGRDIDKGLDRLADVLAGSDGSLEQLCQATVALTAEPRADDVALLLARTRGLEADRVVSWELPADPALVAEARAFTDRRLLSWGLEPLSFATELIVSELVTNAIRHACGPIALRLIYAESLICEVSDGSLSAPHLRRARTNEEGGRGLFLVAQLGSRWGTRYGRAGKTVWVEQTLPRARAAGVHAWAVSELDRGGPDSLA